MDDVEKIYLDDLDKPVRNAVEEEAYRSGAPVEMTPDAVLAAAVERTGLADFGPNDFHERLAVWMQAADEDTGLAISGRQQVWDQAVLYAANRLQLEDLIRRQPEILDIKIDRPIMIAGLPRSGTTHLVNMLAADPRLRSSQLWEMCFPFPLPGEKPGPIEQSPRFEMTKEMWKNNNVVLPHMAAIHEMHPDHVHENIEFQGMDFSSYQLEWRARVPRWSHYYFAHDQTPHYAYEKKMMQALTWMRGPNRWLTKAPPNMENLIPLHTVFPDATIVITHRDPVAVIRSSLTLLAYWDRIRRDEQDLPGLARHWLWRIEMMLKACVRDHDALPQHQVVDVIFPRYMADQEGVVEAIYKAASLDLIPEARDRIKAYIAANRRGRHGAVQYDLSKFGVTVEEIHERFAFYYEKFPVRE